ncbi:MAG: hypothetical protein HOL92_08215, partial [Opitutales bacterium]|nr:hypothetical protein [Opitutales bacterium]
ASRLARYSTAAAGVAAVSTLDVDAAMIKVIVTDPSAEDSTDYTLDLSAIASGARLHISQDETDFSLWGKGASVAIVSISSFLAGFNDGSSIGAKEGSAYQWTIGKGYSSIWSSGSGIAGFRVFQGSSNFTYGWLKITFGSSSSFTLNSYGYNDTLDEAAIAGQGSSAVPDSGPGVVGLALLGAGAAGMRLLRKLRAGK